MLNTDLSFTDAVAEEEYTGLLNDAQVKYDVGTGIALFELLLK